MNIPKPKAPTQRSITNLEGGLSNNQLKAPPRADFDPSRYSKLVQQHGVDVFVEKAVQCPCKTDSHNALGNCENCGGTGWFFINKRKSRMVVTNMSIQNTEEVWSRLVQGLINISYEDDEDLGYMDRVTRINARTIFSEVIQLHEKTTTFGHTIYPIEQIEYLALFDTAKKPLQLLSLDDVVINSNKITLKPTVVLPAGGTTEELTMCVRYKHAPTFHVIEIQREIVDHYKWKNTEKKEYLIYLPGKAIARRAHNVDDMTKQRMGLLHDNSTEHNPLC